MEQAKVQATEWLGGNWQMHTYTTRAGEEAGCCAREKHTVGKANRCRERGEGESRANNRGAKRDSDAQASKAACARRKPSSRTEGHPQVEGGSSMADEATSRQDSGELG